MTHLTKAIPNWTEDEKLELKRRGLDPQKSPALNALCQILFRHPKAPFFQDRRIDMIYGAYFDGLNPEYVWNYLNLTDEPLVFENLLMNLRAKGPFSVEQILQWDGATSEAHLRYHQCFGTAIPPAKLQSLTQEGFHMLSALLTLWDKTALELWETIERFPENVKKAQTA